LFSDAGEVIASTPLSALKPTARVTEQDWFKAAENNIENLHFSTPHVQNLFENSENNYNWVVSLSRSVNLTYNGEIKHGVLLVDMNFSGIEQICRRVSLGDTGYVYIINSEGELIYHPQQQLIYAKLLQENNLAAVNYEDGGKLESFEGKSRFITVKTVGYTGWKIVGVSYMSEVTPYAQIAVFVMLVLIFGIALMVFISFFVSAYIANPIKELEKTVRDIERGGLGLDVSLKASIEARGSTEVRTLGLALNNMLVRIQRLMDEIVNEHEQKRKTELDALQAQINPHFLYNALDSIVWVIEEGEYSDAIALITALSKFFRISISKGKTIISVGDELEHARNYLKIQSIRFKDRFRYVINADESVKSFATIKLIVQPIIENSINHGMEYMDGDGLITVDAYVRAGDLYISVADNGIGMTDDVVGKLLQAPSGNPKRGGSGIGLYNVQERIRLYFGAQYGLSIKSVPDEGTFVMIHLPACVYDPENPGL
jgi:two-component system sensor histidine kinase YesM